MPDIAGLNVDTAALVALGFLVAVLAISLGLFGWVMSQGGKRKRPPQA
ncbi:hypothetical protein [Terricaulis sp.]